MTTNPSEKALRFNQGKPRLSLVSFLAMTGLARVLEFGAIKYAPWNWTKGMPVDQVLDCLLRHTAAIQRGEELDPESGLPHIDHLQCNAMFLSHFYHEGRWPELSEGSFPPRKKT